MKLHVFLMLTLLLNPLLSMAAAATGGDSMSAGAGALNDHCGAVAGDAMPAGLQGDADHQRHTDCADECGNCSVCSAATATLKAWPHRDAMPAYFAPVYRAPPTGVATLVYRPPILS